MAVFLYFVFTVSSASAVRCEFLFYSKEDQMRAVMKAIQADPPGTKTSYRFKILTSPQHQFTDGTIDKRDPVIDAADPSSPFKYVLPNGKTEYRVWLSGLRFLKFSSLDEMVRGGTKIIHRVRGFYQNGMEMTGPYHTSSYPWDGELHQLPDGKFIAHGGAMVSFGPNHLPKVVDENQSRTRQWAEVKFDLKQDGSLDEKWTFIDSIFNDKPLPNDPRWITENHKHKYGATLGRDAKGNYVRDEQGNYEMVYERVVEEKDCKPWLTSLFGCKVTPDLKRVIEGSEVSLINITNPKTGKPFKSSERNKGNNGYLLEGPRPFQVVISGVKTWVIFFSGGDYVTTEYGIHMAIAKPGAGMLGEYQAVVDEKGELIDYAVDLRNMIGASWGPARPSVALGVAPGPNGEMWMENHFVLKNNLPDDFVKSGWPLPEHFIHYPRQVGLTPFKWKIKDNRPVGIEFIL